MAIDNPERFEALLAIADTLSNGETHQNCFVRFQQGYELANYVVTYIVEETVEPPVEEMSEIREVEQKMDYAFNEHGIRREISRKCTYRVDVTGMAVEFTKLSMWLEMLAADR
jgi:hypothetical protein